MNVCILNWFGTLQQFAWDYLGLNPSWKFFRLFQNEAKSPPPSSSTKQNKITAINQEIEWHPEELKSERREKNAPVHSCPPACWEDTCSARSCQLWGSLPEPWVPIYVRAEPLWFMLVSFVCLFLGYRFIEKDTYTRDHTVVSSNKNRILQIMSWTA